MQAYESPIARMRAIYQLPAAPDIARVLELHVADFGPILDHDWPAESAVSCRLVDRVQDSSDDPVAPHGFQTCEASLTAPLPFDASSFDMVILHYTLDDLAKGLASRQSRALAEDWLRRIATILRPDGLIVGCGMNGCSPIPVLMRRNAHGGKGDAGRRRPAMSVLSCAGLLGRAGFQDIQVFNLLPDASNPRSIVSTEPTLSRRALAHEIQSARESVGFCGYLIRKLLLHLSVYRLVEPTLFYWGVRRC